MRIKNYILFSLAAVMSACTNVEKRDVSVRACAVMPTGRASACACVCEGKAYVFGGRGQKGNYLHDLWEYDPTNDSWTDLGQSPMKARVNATMASCNGKIYAGLGYSALHAYNDSAYQKDWWEYTVETGQWKRLADFPCANTVNAHSFAVNGTIYVLYGFGYGFTREVWKYNPSTNTWSEAADNIQRAKRCAGGCGAIKDGVLYFGTGYYTMNLKGWNAADLETDTWRELASIPGKGRELSACAASNQYVYLFGGRYFGGDMTGGEVFETYMRYAPDQNRWEWCGTMPCGRAENQIAFTLNGKAYFGLGENEKGKIINQLYRIED